MTGGAETVSERVDEELHGLMSGYMIKEPLRGNVLSQAKRRYFVLTLDAIEWYENSPFGS